MQLRQVAAFARDRRSEPELLQPHFDSYLALLATCADRPALSTLWLDVVAALHPLPLRWGRWPAWLSILQQAARKSAEGGQPVQQASHLCEVSALLRESGLPDPALAAAQEAYDLGLAAEDANTVAHAAAQIAASLRSLVRFADAQDVLDLAELELHQLSQIGDAELSLLLATTLGIERMELMRHFGQISEAVDLGNHVVDLMESSSSVDSHDLAIAYRRRATILWAAGQFSAAAEDLQHSATLFHKTGDTLAATFSEGNLGLVYYSMARYDQAEVIKRAAVRAAEELNAGWWLVRDVGELCAIYMARGELETALTHCQRHVELAHRFNDNAQLSLARGNRGVTLMLLGRLEDARPDIEASLHHFRQQGRVEGIIAATVDMTLFLRSVGEMETAAEMAAENYTQAHNLSIPSLSILTARCLALFQAPREQEALLNEALSLARKHDRQLDIAGCLFSLSGMVEEPSEGVSMYLEAETMLDQMGAQAWLAGHSPGDPPLLPFFT